MILPLLVEKLAWPVLDWSSAVFAACGHVLLGTLCTLPPVQRGTEPE